jgi:hypothetical protein
MAAATGTTPIINPETGDTYYMPTDVGGGSFGGFGGFGGGDSGGFGGSFGSGEAQGITSNYQGTETPFNPEIGKIGPNILEKAWNYITDNPRKVLSTIGNFTVGPIATAAANAAYDVSQGVDPTAIAKNFVADTVTGKLVPILGKEAASLGPLAQGAVQGAASYGIPSLLKTGDVDFGNLGIAAASGGIGREIGSEFGPMAAAAARTATSGLMRGQDPNDVFGNIAMNVAKSEFNQATFPGAANLAEDAWRYFNPEGSSTNVASLFQPGNITSIGGLFAPQGGFAPGELDREQMAVGPRDPVGYVPDPSLIGDYGGGSGGGSAAPSPAPAPVAAAPSPAPAPAPSPVAAAPAQDNSELVALLLGLGLMDTGGQSPIVQQTAASAPMPAFDVNSMFLSSYLGDKNRQPRTVAELLQSLRTA